MIDCRGISDYSSVYTAQRPEWKQKIGQAKSNVPVLFRGEVEAKSERR